MSEPKHNGDIVAYYPCDLSLYISTQDHEAMHKTNQVLETTPEGQVMEHKAHCSSALTQVPLLSSFLRRAVVHRGTQ